MPSFISGSKDVDDFDNRKCIVTYATPQHEISIVHQISLIVLILFYYKQDKLTVSVTHIPILASRPRRRRICPGGRL